MSMDSVKSQYQSDEKTDVDASVDDITWKIKSGGYFESVDDRFYGEDTPNKPPLMPVPDKLAADMDYIQDSGYAMEVATQLDFNTPSRYNSVVRILFNDFSTWNWPILDECDGISSELDHFVNKYIPQIIQWEAIVAGEDPNDAVDEWAKDTTLDETWMKDVGNTHLTEDQRKFFNDKVEWMEYISKDVESSEVSVKADGDWTDDW